MFTNKKTDSKLYCFTPLATLVTFIVESLLALYVLLKHKRTMLGGLIIATLISLGMFQLAEYMMCGLGFESSFWPRLGYSFTALLPPLGFHLVQVINQKDTEPKRKIGIGIAYLWAAIVIVGFFATEQMHFAYECTGKYVTFAKSSGFHDLYRRMYKIVIGIAIAQLLYTIYKTTNKQLRTTNIWFLISYLVFIIPTLTLVFLGKVVQAGMPSVMCGFAILTGIILVAKVLPSYNEQQGETGANKNTL